MRSKFPQDMYNLLGFSENLEPCKNVASFFCLHALSKAKNVIF